MPSLTLSDKLIWFAHCPKAGGTSVERFMVDNFGDAVGHLHWGWDLWWRNGGWRQADPPSSPQHLIWRDSHSVLSKTPDAVFAVVRDPLSRLISEYWYQRTARRGTRTGRLLAHLSFSSWSLLMLEMAKKNPYVFDNHIRPQNEFVPEGAEVFRLENGLNAALAWLSNAAGAPEPDGSPQVLVSRPCREITVYSTDIVRINSAYARDYDRFGYEQADPDAYPADPAPRMRTRLTRTLLPLVLRLERCGNL